MVVLERAMIDAAVRAVLSQIHDPCSIAAGRPTSLLDMGLVRGWSFDQGMLTVDFCVTFAGCTMAPHFTQAAAEALGALPHVTSVVTRIDTDFIWTPELMTAPPPVMRGTPQAWRTRAAIP
jgi:metal-sulfur cluster biosynthetic enzyme